MRKFGHYEDDEEEWTPYARPKAQPVRSDSETKPQYSTVEPSPALQEEPAESGGVDGLLSALRSGLAETEAKLAAVEGFDQEQQGHRLQGTSPDGAVTALVDGAGVVLDLALRRPFSTGREDDHQWWSSIGGSIVAAVQAAQIAAGTANDAAFLARFPDFAAAFDLQGRG